MIVSFICLLLTVAVYIASKWFYKKIKFSLLTPLLITPAIIVCLLLAGDISYSTYEKGAKWLSVFLQPATVAFAIPLYKFFPTVKKYAKEIGLAVLTGSVISMVSSSLFAVLFHFKTSLLHSIIPYSVTTPIAMGVSSKLGGIPNITAIFVIITGIIGMIIGPIIIRIFRVKSDIARGVLLGTSSHGCGTTKALEVSNLAGAVSSICMILAAMLSVFLSPLLTQYILHL